MGLSPMETPPLQDGSPAGSSVPSRAASKYVPTTRAAPIAPSNQERGSLDPAEKPTGAGPSARIDRIEKFLNEKLHWTDEMMV